MTAVANFDEWMALIEKDYELTLDTSLKLIDAYKHVVGSYQKPLHCKVFKDSVHKIIGDIGADDFNALTTIADESDGADPMYYCERLNIEIGTVSVLVAEANAGKSTLALLLTVLSSRGLSFLGSPVSQGASIYMHFDCAKRNLVYTRAKYDRHYASLGTTGENTTLYYSDNKGSKLDTAIGLKRFDTLAKGLSERGGRLIIIDSLYSCISPELDTNSAKSRNFIDSISKIAEKYGVAILLIHHMNKSGKSSGSQTIIDAAHNVVEMTRDDLTVKLKVVKTRNGIDFENNTMQYSLCKSISGNLDNYWIEEVSAVEKELEKQLEEYISKLKKKESFISIWKRFTDDKYRGEPGCPGWKQSQLLKSKFAYE